VKNSCGDSGHSFGGNFIQLDTLIFIFVGVSNHRRRSLLSTNQETALIFHGNA